MLLNRAANKKPPNKTTTKTNVKLLNIISSPSLSPARLQGHKQIIKEINLSYLGAYNECFVTL
jgi:hypothetical protein